MVAETSELKTVDYRDQPILFKAQEKKKKERKKAGRETRKTNNLYTQSETMGWGRLLGKGLEISVAQSPGACGGWVPIPVKNGKHSKTLSTRDWSVGDGALLGTQPTAECSLENVVRLMGSKRRPQHVVD